MKKLFLFFALIIISISTLNAQKASKANFSKIGETTVDFKSGNGAVTISGGDAYKALRVKTDAPLHMESLSVVYQDGTTESIPVRYDFKAGVESRDIVLKGNKQIKEVDFVYRKVANSNTDKATVAISGSK